jgi:hypothetical protein
MSQETKWTNELLDDMRHQQDDFADNAAAALFESFQNLDRESVNHFMTAFASQDFSHHWESQKYANLFPSELTDYFNNYEEFRYSENERMILEKGSEFFAKYGPGASMALGVRSLLKQYAATKAIQVLRMTTLLEKHVNRRIMETIQFLLDVMEPGWHKTDNSGLLTDELNIHHVGLQSIKKLRLLHAMARYRILHKMTPPAEGDWDMNWGKPINQEDMVFAIHTFSVEVLQGLIESGEAITDEEIETYFHCWRLVGRGLGVSPKLEPVSYQDGCDLQNLIYKRQFTLPNPYGPVLAKALVDWMDETIPILPRSSIIEIIKEFNGPENYQVLEVNLDLNLGDKTNVDLEQHLRDVHGKHYKQKAQSYNTKSENLSEVLYFEFMENLLRSERKGKKAHFRIGDGFKAQWDLNEVDETPPSGLSVIWVTIKSVVGGFFTWLKGLFSSK